MQGLRSQHGRFTNKHTSSRIIHCTCMIFNAVTWDHSQQILWGIVIELWSFGIPFFVAECCFIHLLVWFSDRTIFSKKGALMMDWWKKDDQKKYCINEADVRRAISMMMAPCLYDDCTLESLKRRYLHHLPYCVTDRYPTTWLTSIIVYRMHKWTSLWYLPKVRTMVGLVAKIVGLLF